MTKITTILQLRKLIKPLGYNVKTKTFSFGKFGTFFKKGDECPAIFSGKENLAEGEPLFGFLKGCTLELDEKVYGLSRYFAE